MAWLSTPVNADASVRVTVPAAVTRLGCRVPMGAVVSRIPGLGLLQSISAWRWRLASHTVDRSRR